MNIDVGTVVRWNNFPLPKYGEEKKPRWFICIGFTGIFAQVAEVYFCTTTAQIDKFNSGGIREKRDHYIFQTNHPKYSMFDENCIIDFEEKPYVVTKNKLNYHQNDIEIRGELDEQTLRMIYNCILKSNRRLSLMEKRDIHDSYNKFGITGLKKPK
ncbi:MAG: hypothetical protein KJ697_02145 [Nanoarchaeota archaeon]|nr:hypothetical protein [Nanoarchaeota archaeon]MBU4124137.1 hypothetical protein [Nanoarchaeota archaeon]